MRPVSIFEAKIFVSSTYCGIFAGRLLVVRALLILSLELGLLLDGALFDLGIVTLLVWRVR